MDEREWQLYQAELNTAYIESRKRYEKADDPDIRKSRIDSRLEGLGKKEEGFWDWFKANIDAI